MKAKHLWIYFLVLTFCVVAGPVSTSLADSLEGCGIVEIACGNSGTNAKVKSGYFRKVDNFLVLQDTSTSMGEDLAEGSEATKIEFSKGLVSCMNDTLPDNYAADAGLRNFGFLTADKGLVYGLTGYTSDGLAGAVNSIKGTAGVTPIAKAFNYGTTDLKGTSGPTAVILFSDGVNTVPSDPVAAAAAMKQTHPSVCIYTVQIGNDPMGEKTMQQIADASGCGFSVNGSSIADGQGMEKFVTDVFLTRKERAMTLLIQFDFDKDDIKAEFHDDIARVAKALNANPGSKAQLEGHTDDRGDDAYNMSLSKRRAESVKKYLVEKFGIKASRLTTVGYGESKPVASNDSAAGRYKNRRVVVNFH